MEMQNYKAVQVKNNLFPELARKEHLGAQTSLACLNNLPSTSWWVTGGSRTTTQPRAIIFHHTGLPLPSSKIPSFGRPQPQHHLSILVML